MSEFAKKILQVSVNAVALKQHQSLIDISDIDKELEETQEEIDQLQRIMRDAQQQNSQESSDRLITLLEKCYFWMIALREGANVLASFSTEETDKGQMQ
jgi:ATP-dependent protease HslVU (ClpYQ) ATPase subunit